MSICRTWWIISARTWPTETPRCQVEFIAADLREADARREVFTRAAAQGPVLVITEGLLIYLEPDHVAELARDLHDIAKAKWWLSDLASPMLLKFLEKRWSPKLREGKAPFRFGPAEGTGILRALRLARDRIPLQLG